MKIKKPGEKAVQKQAYSPEKERGPRDGSWGFSGDLITSKWGGFVREERNPGIISPRKLGKEKKGRSGAEALLTIKKE